MKKPLFIGGFDGTCGGGVIADFRVCEAFNINPAILITFIANANFGAGIPNSSTTLASFTTAIEAIFASNTIEYVKIGMVGSEDLANFLEDFLKDKNVKVVLDTPLKTSKNEFLQNARLLKPLIKQAFIVTPNKQEFEEFGGIEFFKECNSNVLVKSFTLGMDKLFLHSQNVQKDFILPPLTLAEEIRGTGCSLASAICLNLFNGQNLEDAILNAKTLLYKAMQNTQTQSIKHILKF